MSNLELIERFQVNDVFATTSFMENAGGGCTRIYNCVQRNGLLVPVGNTVIFPTVDLLKTAQTAHEFARRLALIELDGSRVH